MLKVSALLGMVTDAAVDDAATTIRAAGTFEPNDAFHEYAAEELSSGNVPTWADSYSDVRRVYVAAYRAAWNAERSKLESEAGGDDPPEADGISTFWAH